MTAECVTRRQVSFGAASIAAALGASGTANAQMRNEGSNLAASNLGISRVHAAIHQEIDFAAAASRLYRVLTEAEQFDKVVRASAAMNSGMKAKLGTAPTELDARPGGAFVLFGGYITGRTLELVPGARIVQAWRAGSWDTGVYSIASFQLVAHGAGTRLIFDHAGFPDEAAEHLAQGWYVNYWQPLATVLG